LRLVEAPCSGSSRTSSSDRRSKYNCDVLPPAEMPKEFKVLGALYSEGGPNQAATSGSGRRTAKTNVTPDGPRSDSPPTRAGMERARCLLPIVGRRCHPLQLARRWPQPGRPVRCCAVFERASQLALADVVGNPCTRLRRHGSSARSTESLEPTTFSGPSPTQRRTSADMLCPPRSTDLPALETVRLAAGNLGRSSSFSQVNTASRLRREGTVQYHASLQSKTRGR
jgi:hypothetical protein